MSIPTSWRVIGETWRISSNLSSAVSQYRQSVTLLGPNWKLEPVLPIRRCKASTSGSPAVALKGRR